MNYLSLLNNVTIPQLGMGGWAQKEKDIISALQMGYRLLDTAAQYGNEEEIGNAIKHAGVPREEIFITTKLWTEDIRQGRTIDAFKESLRRLQVDYVDLYLIHWPAEGREKAWHDMESLYDQGYIRSIGVSNFQIHHFETLMQKAKYMPVVNQIEEHPYFTNQEIVDYCQTNNVAIEAWCPLGGPGSGILRDASIVEIANHYKKTTAQIILRWQIERGIIVIPKSANEEHMKSNMEIFDFSLTDKEIAVITALNKNGRLGANPDDFNF